MDYTVAHWRGWLSRSLPEFVGGTRKWDYRDTWIRCRAHPVRADAARFHRRGGRIHDVAGGTLPGRGGWPGIAGAVAVDGNPEVPESVLDHLDGYRGSRPVRVGNSAAGQRQLDIYGEPMDAVYLYNKYGCPIGYDL